MGLDIVPPFFSCNIGFFQRSRITPCHRLKKGKKGIKSSVLETNFLLPVRQGKGTEPAINPLRWIKGYARTFYEKIVNGLLFKNSLMNRFIPEALAIQVVRQIKEKGFPFNYDFEKHRLLISTSTNEAPSEDGPVFRLPLTISPHSLEKEKSGEETMERKVRYIMLLIQSGHCAMGLFEGVKNLDHKVFRAYMVRKKQGKSQLKHLKTKGKSRAGSRVRLAGTVEFFENINSRLQSYFENYQIERMAISCSKTLIPFLFNSKVETPFAKNDERLYRIPRHVHIPKFEEMMEVQKFLSRGEWIYEEEHLPLIHQLLGEGNEEGKR